MLEVTDSAPILSTKSWTAAGIAMRMVSVERTVSESLRMLSVLNLLMLHELRVAPILCIAMDPRAAIESVLSLHLLHWLLVLGVAPHHPLSPGRLLLHQLLLAEHHLLLILPLLLLLLLLPALSLLLLRQTSLIRLLSLLQNRSRVQRRGLIHIATLCLLLMLLLQMLRLLRLLRIQMAIRSGSNTMALRSGSKHIHRIGSMARWSGEFEGRRRGRRGRAHIVSHLAATDVTITITIAIAIATGGIVHSIRSIFLIVTRPFVCCLVLCTESSILHIVPAHCSDCTDCTDCRRILLVRRQRMGRECTLRAGTRCLR